MTDFFKDARKAKSSGDFLKAGDLYTMGGDVESAIEAYLQGHHYAHAARLYEKDQDYRNAARAYAQAGKYEKSALLYVNDNDFKKASEMFEKSGDFARASEMAQKAGDIAAAALLADRGEKWDRAAELYVKVHNYERAADIFVLMMDRFLKDKKDGAFLESTLVRIKKYGNSAGQLYAHLQKYDQASRCFEEAESFSKAAECHSRCGRSERAAELFQAANDFAGASREYEKAGRLQRAFEMAEKSTDTARAAALAEKTGNFDRAASLYIKIDQGQKAADMLFQVVIKELDELAAGRFVESRRMNIRKSAATAAGLYARLNQTERAAWCYEQSDQFQRAAECYAAVKNNQKAGELFYRAGVPAKAYELLTSSDAGIQKPEMLAEICFQLQKYAEAGDLFVHAQNTKRAAEAYDKANNRYKAALLYEECEEFGRAAAMYEELDEPRKAALLYLKAGMLSNAGHMFERSNQMDDALAAFRRAADKYHAGRLLEKKGEKEAAAALLKDVTTQDEHYRDARALLGAIQMSNGMDAEAVENLAAALRDSDPDRTSLDSWYNYAVLQEKLGQRQTSLEIYGKILTFEPAYRDVPNRIQRLQNPAPMPVPEKAPSTAAAPSTPPPVSTGVSQATAANDPLVGKRIREYEILEILGKGGMGSVYRARHVFLDKERAIKVIESRLVSTAFSDRFIREARILNDLHSPQLVQLYEFGMLDEHQYFMVLELIRGVSVKTRIREVGRIPIRDAIEIVRQAAIGLQCAHERGIVHRDISPDNLMLVRDSSGSEMTKVIDFGIAKPLAEEGDGFTATNMFIGKPEFASPEQCGFLPHGEKIDHRTDIYSLTITLYLMLTGSLPFYSPTPQGYLVKHVSQEPKPLSDFFPPENLPQALVNLILKGVNKERDNRHSSMAEYLKDLEAIPL